MNKAQQTKFDSLYQQHVSALRRQGKAATTIDVYSRAVRRITAFFDTPPDQLIPDHFKTYFDSLVKSHSWSTVRIERNGLQFFYKNVLNKQWDWIAIVKPPQKSVLPDILSVAEVERLAGLHLRAIQHEMGHDSPKTTALYTQMTEVAHQDSAILINSLVNRLDLTLDGEV